MSYDTPTPGSDAAREQGCKCPVIDNHYGRGRGDGQFWISENCPLHDPALRSACERAGDYNEKETSNV